MHESAKIAVLILPKPSGGVSLETNQQKKIGSWTAKYVDLRAKTEYVALFSLYIMFLTCHLRMRTCLS